MHEFTEKVRSILASEQGRQEKVTDPSQVPGSYDAITPEWLSKILCRDTPGAEIVSSSLDAPDDGTSNRRRIFLTYNDAGQRAGLPSSVFCKAAAAVSTRTALNEFGLAEAEANFYSKARPRLDMLAPEAYYAAYDPETYAYFIMMKDMGKEVTFPNERNEISLAQAESQVDTLARLHSRFYQSPELGTATLPFVKWQDLWLTMMRVSPGFAPCCDQAFGESEHIMAVRLFKRRAEVWPKTMASAAAHAKLPHTLIHSDVHLANWFITADNRMGLHDWQVITIGHWSRDFIYAITTSLTVENRRAWEKDLLARYLDTMAELGVPLAESGAKLASSGETWKNLRQQLLTALAFWTITLRPAPEMSEMQPEQLTWKLLERLFAAVDDHDALDAFD
jgi:hypothetical protein